MCITYVFKYERQVAEMLETIEWHNGMEYHDARLVVDAELLREVSAVLKFLPRNNTLYSELLSEKSTEIPVAMY
tara:strand:- start:723 stop:944 length:222 start_codon:yes stop_codon:yes gene_type:complete